MQEFIMTASCLNSFSIPLSQALVSIKEKIREIEGPDVKENMQDQIRQWFIECRLVLQSFFVG